MAYDTETVHAVRKKKGKNPIVKEANKNKIKRPVILQFLHNAIPHNVKQDHRELQNPQSQPLGLLP